MQITNNSLFSFFINLGCALGNAYQAPGTFSLGFAVGIISGMGMGLKHRIALLTVDLNERAVQKIVDKSQPVQEMFAPINEKINESAVVNFAKRVYVYLQPIFRAFLYVTGYLAMVDTAASYLGNFEEQRMDLIKKLNPIPGIVLSLLSLGALATNFGYIQNTWTGKVTLLSGVPAGYAAGTFLMRNLDWGFLGSQPYAMALAKSGY